MDNKNDKFKSNSKRSKTKYDYKKKFNKNDRGYIDKSSATDVEENLQKGERVGKFTEADKRIATKGGNDPEFYYVNERIGEAVANIPFNVFPGTQIKVLREPVSGIQPSGYPAQDESGYTNGSVMTLNYYNSIGDSISPSSAVNIAAKGLYTWVRHQNSGHSNYESSDLMLYILAMSEIYTAFLEAKRIYATAMTYDYANRNIPDMLLKAMRVNPENIRENMAQFRAELNLLAAKISSMAVPNRFNLFKRKAAIASSVLTDSDSMRGQFYIWTRIYGFTYDPTHANGGALVHHNISENRGYRDVINELKSMIDTVISDEDMNIMSGDILKAYGRENLYVLQDVDESATTLFVHDENMLQQVENSTAFGTNGNASATDIIQNNNVLISDPMGHCKAKIDVLSKLYYNSHVNNPNWKLNLEFTRGMGFGSEVITWYTVFYFNYTSQGTCTVEHFTWTTFYPENSSISIHDRMNQICKFQNFDWHPITYTFNTLPTDTSMDDPDNRIQYYGVMGDLKYFTTISWDTLSRLNDSALMGLYNTLLLSQNTTY